MCKERVPLSRCVPRQGLLPVVPVCCCFAVSGTYSDLESGWRSGRVRCPGSTVQVSWSSSGRRSSATVVGGWMVSGYLVLVEFAASLAGGRYLTRPRLGGSSGDAARGWSLYLISWSGTWSVPAGRELVHRAK